MRSISSKNLKSKEPVKCSYKLIHRLYGLVVVDSPVQIVQRIGPRDGVRLVEILTLGDADPLVEFFQVRAVKILSFGGAAGNGFACGVWLSE